MNPSISIVPGVRGRRTIGGYRDFHRRLRIEPLEDRRLLSVDLVSIGDPSLHIPGNGSSGSASISSDGRHIAFASDASNLVNDDRNAHTDIFVKDVVTGSLELVSADGVGNQGNGNSINPSISADGRYVAFESAADNFFSGDTNGNSDVFVKDLTTGSLTCVSSDVPNNSPNSEFISPSMSSDGRYVAFERAVLALTSSGYDVADIFLKDMVTGSLSRISPGADDNANFYFFSSPSISADGRYVAFSGDLTYTSTTGFERTIDQPSGQAVAVSNAVRSMVGDTPNDWSGVFVKDLTTGAFTRVDTDSAGNKGDGDAWYPNISGDGRYVAFQSSADNLVAGDTNNVFDVFVKDLNNGSIRRVSTDSTGNQGNGFSRNPSISADGRYVAFSSDASNLALGDTNHETDVFVKDLAIGVTRLISADSTGNPGNGPSTEARISEDGRYVTFWSIASSLHPDATMTTADIFRWSAPADAQRPTAWATAANVNLGGSTSYFFDITYTDNVAVDASTLKDSRVSVTGPKGFSQLAILDHLDDDSDSAMRTATYRITPPHGMWTSADKGTYAVSLEANQVTDLAGNPVAPGTLGTFIVKAAPDKFRPKAVLNAPDVTAIADETHTFTVTYTDNVEIKEATLDNFDLLVTGPRGYRQRASLVSTVSNASGSQCVATYRIVPPVGAWDAAHNGAYTVTMQSKQVKDTSGNAVAAGKLGLFMVDTISPTASLSAAKVTRTGGKIHTFTVMYKDNIAVDVATLSNSNIVVTGPNGFRQLAALVSVDKKPSGTRRTATYQVAPLGGAWDLVDNGTYTISIQPNQVTDAVGNSIAGGVLGTFVVAISDTVSPTTSLKDPNIATASSAVSQSYAGGLYGDSVFGVLGAQAGDLFSKGATSPVDDTFLFPSPKLLFPKTIKNVKH